MTIRTNSQKTLSQKNAIGIVMKERVRELLDNFACVLGGRVVFFDRDGSVVLRGRGEGNSSFCTLIQTSYFSPGECSAKDREMRELCEKDGKCHFYCCHASLREAVMGVKSPDGTLLGYLMFGQFRSTKTLPARLRKLAKDVVSLREMEEKFSELPYFSDEGMQNLASLLELFVDYIVHRELVTPEGDTLLSAIRDYIDRNYRKDISIGSAAKFLGRSVSGISHFLKQRSSPPFRRLLAEKRISEAERILRENPLVSVKETSEMVGIGDFHYFSRLYKKLRSLPPGRARTLSKEEESGRQP